MVLLVVVVLGGGGGTGAGGAVVVVVVTVDAVGSGVVVFVASRPALSSSVPTCPNPHRITHITHTHTHAGTAYFGCLLGRTLPRGCHGFSSTWPCSWCCRAAPGRARARVSGRWEAGGRSRCAMQASVLLLFLLMILLLCLPMSWTAVVAVVLLLLLLLCLRISWTAFVVMLLCCCYCCCVCRCH